MRNSARSTNVQPREWPTLRVTVVLSLILASGTIVNLPARALPCAAPLPPGGSDDFVLDHDLLIRRLHETHVFLMERKHGLPYTPDARLLEPYSEVMRLLVDSQSLGYLNLYRLTGQPLYRRKAEERLRYILGLGGRALAHKRFDGQVAYSLLEGAEVTGDSSFPCARSAHRRVLLRRRRPGDEPGLARGPQHGRGLPAHG